MSDKYYFRMIGPDWDKMCIEKCMVKGCMIGSVNCQECENNIGHNSDETPKYQGPDWIKCKEIDKATGKQTDKE